MLPTRVSLLVLLSLAWPTLAGGQAVHADAASDSEFRRAVESGNSLGRELLRDADVLPAQEGEVREDERRDGVFYTEDWIQTDSEDQALRSELEKIGAGEASTTRLKTFAEQMRAASLQDDSIEAEAATILSQGRQNERYIEGITSKDAVFDAVRSYSRGIVPRRYADLIGTCETEVNASDRRERVQLTDTAACAALWQGDIASCSARRSASFDLLGRRTVATLSLEEPSDECQAAGSTAYAQCTLGECAVVEERSRAACEADCQSGDCGCDRLAEEALASCEADAPEQRCQAVHTAEYGFCRSVTCAGRLGLTCACNNPFAGQCENRCERARRDAIATCAGGEAGGVSGTFSIAFEALGSARQFVDVVNPAGQRAALEIAPFELSGPLYDARGNPLQFVAEWVAHAEGGTAEFIPHSLGSLANNFTVTGTLTLRDATEVKLSAAHYLVRANSIEGCESYLDSLADGMCSGSLRCSVPPVFELGGVRFETGPAHAGILDVLHPWHSTSAPRGEVQSLAPAGCTTVTSGPLSCDYHIGHWGTYTDLQGNAVTVTGRDENVRAPSPILGAPWADNCGAIDAETACTLKRVGECSEEGRFTGRCYVRDVQFDCTTEREYRVAADTQETMQCDGVLRCIGDGCVDLHDEVNTSLAKAATVSSTAQFLDMEMTCDDGRTGPGCDDVAFRGRHLSCRQPVGGSSAPDCCAEGLDAARNYGLSASEYLKLQRGSAALNNYHSALQDEEAKERLDRAPGDLYSGSVSGADSAVGMTRQVVSGLQSIGAVFGEQVASEDEYDALATDVKRDPDRFYRRMRDGFEEYWSDSGHVGLGQYFEPGARFEQAKSTGAKSGRAGAHTAAKRRSNRGFSAAEAAMEYGVDRIYHSPGFQCTADEARLGAMRAARSCLYVGQFCERGEDGACIVTRSSYCCYETALGRMAVADLAEGREKSFFGDPRAPNCGPYDGAVVEQVDWADLDTDEWTYLLHDAGLVPTLETADSRFSQNRLTRKSMIAGEDATVQTSAGQLPNAQRRNWERVKVLTSRADSHALELEQKVYAGQTDLSTNAAALPWWEQVVREADEEQDLSTALPGDYGREPDRLDCPSPATGWTPHERPGSHGETSQRRIPTGRFGTGRLSVSLTATSYLAERFQLRDEPGFVYTWRIGSAPAVEAVVSRCPGVFDDAYAVCRRTEWTDGPWRFGLAEHVESGWCAVKAEQPYFLNVRFARADGRPSCDKPACELEYAWYR